MTKPVERAYQKYLADLSWCETAEEDNRLWVQFNATCARIARRRHVSVATVLDEVANR